MPHSTGSMVEESLKRSKRTSASFGEERTRVVGHCESDWVREIGNLRFWSHIECYPMRVCYTSIVYIVLSTYGWDDHDTHSEFLIILFPLLSY